MVEVNKWKKLKVIITPQAHAQQIHVTAARSGGGGNKESIRLCIFPFSPPKLGKWTRPKFRRWCATLVRPCKNSNGSKKFHFRSLSPLTSPLFTFLSKKIRKYMFMFVPPRKVLEQKTGNVARSSFRALF